jgi:hypothetical protein
MQTRLLFHARRLLLCAALPALAACHKQDPSAPDARTITLDSDPAGCEVFLDGTSLGTTPCVLNQARLRELGLQWPEYVQKGNALSMSWGPDPTGILIQQGGDGDAWRKLMFKPPGGIAAAIATAETPWGGMAFTRILDRGGADENHLTYRFTCLPVQTVDGLVLKMSAPPGGIKPGGKCAATLACHIQPGATFAGFRPGVEIYCSRFDEPAMRHALSKAALPDAWRFFKPGEDNTATVEFTLPGDAGDYCLFAVVTLYRQPEGGATCQPVYSNGVLLRLQR